jgi:membrane fusion protein (multidrug efflux system)
VEREAPLFRVHDDGIAVELERAAIDVKGRGIEAEKFERLAEAEKQKLDLYRLIGQRAVDKANANVAVARSRLTRDASSWERAQRLYADNIVSDAQLETAKTAFENAKADLEAAEAELARARDAVAAISKGRFHTGDRLDGELVESEILAKTATSDVDLAREKLAALEAQNTRLTIGAPFRGRVVQVLKTPGNVVDRGEPILVLEHDRRRQIVAFLTQAEIVRVAADREVMAYVPALDRTLRARVVEIDRTSGAVEESATGFAWQAPEGRTARIVLDILELSAEEVRRDLPAGLPVIINLPKQRGPLGFLAFAKQARASVQDRLAAR